MNRTRPVSMYFSFNRGNVFCSNVAQWVHVIEEYSTMVTGAPRGPSAMSGSETGSRANDAVLACALAKPGTTICVKAKTTRAAKSGRAGQ
jgi:hypothetical protein